MVPLLRRAEVGGAAGEVFGDFFGHQVAVLVAALVGLSFDVQVDPAGGRIAVGRSERRTASRAGQASLAPASSRLTPENQAAPREKAPPLPAISTIWSEERLATNFSERRVHGRVPPSEVEWTSKGMEAMERAAPVAIGERSRSRNGQVVGLDPGGELVAFADDEIHGREADDGGHAALGRVETHRLRAIALDDGIDSRRAGDDGKVLGLVDGRLIERCGGVQGHTHDDRDEKTKHRGPS